MASFRTPYGLSNSGQEKWQFTPFWGGPKPVCSDGLRAGTIESHNFFVLGPILVKFHTRTHQIESFRTMFRTWWCGEEKLHFIPFDTLRKLKRDEALFYHLLGADVHESSKYSCGKPPSGTPTPIPTHPRVVRKELITHPPISNSTIRQWGLVVLINQNELAKPMVWILWLITRLLIFSSITYRQ